MDKKKKLTISIPEELWEIVIAVGVNFGRNTPSEVVENAFWVLLRKWFDADPSLFDEYFYEKKMDLIGMLPDPD